jgi:hypothetical protein
MNAVESNQITGTVYGRAIQTICRLNLRLAVAVTWACVAALGALGLAYNLSTSLQGHGYIHKPAGGLLAQFDLDAEHVPPALFSAMLLVVAAALAFLVARAGLRDGGARRWWLLMALVFAWMSLDEAAAVHEKLQDATGVKWQAIYAPLFVVAAAAGLKVVAALWRYRPAALVFLGGGACWFVSQAIEAWQWKHGYLLHPLSIIPEETLEMSGSALFALAIVLVIRYSWGAGPASSDRESDAMKTALASGL